MLIVVAKATYELGPGSSLVLAEKQLPVSFAGESWGEPGQSSFKYEPEVSWLKPATDVVLIAHAWAPNLGTNVMDIEFRVGPVRRTARVFGDRTWRKGRPPRIGSPLRFESIPLVYERALGGWDKSHPDPAKHTFDARNPVGRGFVADGNELREGTPLPNIEAVETPIDLPSSRPAPVGLGFTSPHWQPRAAFGGTYDEAWLERRAPLLAEDFSRRYFSAASEGLVAPGYLRGDEPVMGKGVTRTGKLSFFLPGQPPPRVRVALRGEEDEAPEMLLDTVIVNTDEDKLLLLWRTEVSLATGPHDIIAIEVDSSEIRAQKRAG